MITEEKKFEIRKKIKRGYPQGELINDLLAQGFSQEDINAIFNETKPGFKFTDKTKTTNIPVWNLLNTSFVIIGISILSVKNLWIYNYGYFFLITGLAGFIVKFTINAGKKK